MRTIQLPRIFARQLAFGIIAAASMAIPSVSRAVITGEWETHPSFDRHCVAILDSRRFTYFLLLQQYHHNTSSTRLTDPFPALFRHDRENPGAGIVPVAGTPGVTLLNVRTARYNHDRNYLMAVGKEGIIEIYHDNGDVVTITDLAYLHVRGPRDVNSITFSSNGDVWVAADFGAACVDVDNGCIKSIIRTDQPVMQAASFRPGALLLTQDEIYVVDKEGKREVNLTDTEPMAFTPLPEYGYLVSGSTLVKPEALMPLSDTSFAIMGVRKDGSAGKSVNVATIDGNNAIVFSLFEDALRTVSPDEMLSMQTEGNALPTIDGYYIHSNNVAYHIKKGIDPDLSAEDPAGAFKERILTSKYKLSDGWRDSGTCDMTEFWFNYPRKGFYCRRADEQTGSQTQWSDVYPRTLPEGPRPFVCNYMTWHPDYGFMFSNRGYSYMIESNTPIPWLVSGLKQGKWKNYSPVFNPPDYVDSDPDLAKAFTSGENRYPVYNPRGFAIDPDDPRFVYAGSLLSGLARINLADPSAPALHIGSPTDFNRNLPGFIEGAPKAENWSEACDFTAPSFDADHNLWVAFNPRYKDLSTTRAELWYLTPEMRKEMENANTDPSSYREWGKLMLPIPGRSISACSLFLALSSPSNRNILVYSPGGYNGPIYVIDHNGTPGDPSDDTVKLLERDFSRDGRQISQKNICSLYEDPETGRVWVCCEMGAYSFVPSDALAGINSIEHPISQISVNCVATDPLGRLWFGTPTNGVICMSSDSTTRLATFDTAGSPIPSDAVYGIAYNPERGSMFISTGAGIVEFFPDSFVGGDHETTVRVNPSTVTSGWQGWVTISGLPDGTDIEIVDKDGRKVAYPGHVREGRLQWDATGADGLRLPTGRYGIIVSGGSERLAEIKIFN